MSDILCMFYSRTGNTEETMKEIAAALEAELVEITDDVDRSGLRVLPVLTCSFWLSAISMIWVLIAASVTGNLAFGLPGKVWIFYALLALIAMVLGATLFQLGVRFCGPVRATLFSTLEPVTAVIVGLLAFHETLQGRMIIGIVLILLAVLVLAWPAKKDEKNKNPEA